MSFSSFFLYFIKDKYHLIGKPFCQEAADTEEYIKSSKLLISVFKINRPQIGAG